MINRKCPKRTRSNHRHPSMWVWLIVFLVGAHGSVAWSEPTKHTDAAVTTSANAHDDALAFYEDMIGFVFAKCDRATWDVLATNRSGDFSGLAVASGKMVTACSATISSLEQTYPPESIGALASFHLNTTLAACKNGYAARKTFAEKLSERAKNPQGTTIKDELQQQFQIWDIQGQLCVGGLERMAFAAGVSTDELVKAWLDVYVDCVKGRIRTLSDGDKSVKDYFPLLSLSDDETRGKVRDLCPGSGPAGLTVVNHPNVTGALDKFLIKRRTELLKALHAIHAPGPQPAIILRSLHISADDYPSEALDKREQGVSTLTYTIGTDGQITHCKATGASKTLDTKSCEYVSSRMMFFPARNREGKAIEETRTQTVNWVLPY